MQRLGLALSGGGFRATLYHLGVVRFLRDSGVLPRITHITSVSGGSILGAHLVLNWDRYCGSPAEFDEAAGEILRFVKMDVRNRIVRRFPMASFANMTRRMFRQRPYRQWTRPGLLEQHYEKYLYGDLPLSQLPDRPRIHILATNLSEGCLCSFEKNGLLLQRRVPGRRDRFERVQIGLATVAMAVAASSAFPGFFPPLDVHGWDVGAEEGDFSRQAFTDGGVYDNLGLRMFRCIEQSGIRDAGALRKQDFLDLDQATEALLSATNLPERTPLRRLREILDAHDRTKELQSHNIATASDVVVRGLWEILRSEQLYLDEVFKNVELIDPSAQSLLNYIVQSDRHPDMDNRMWLNRQIVEAALRQVIGKPCLKQSRKDFDHILVSDAGGKFKVTRDLRAGGIVRTALRSSDILMDRVWQLELEAFERAQGIIPFQITDIVDHAHDATAPHPEIQRQAARIRTDLDRFSDLEISALIQQGYCVARKNVRSEASELQAEIETEPPWDPNLPSSNSQATGSGLLAVDPTPALPVARKLRNSSSRKIWSTLLSLTDWPSYVWASLAICLTLAIYIGGFRMYERYWQQQMVLSAVEEMSPNYRKILGLLRSGPIEGVPPMTYSEVDTLPDPKLTGLEVLSDTRIFDLRGWADIQDQTPATAYVRLLVRRTKDEMQDDDTHLRIPIITRSDAVMAQCEPASLSPRLFRAMNMSGVKDWQLDLDFSHVPIGVKEQISLVTQLGEAQAKTFEDEGQFTFMMTLETSLLEVWVLMPENRQFSAFEVSSFPVDKPEQARIVLPHSTVQLPVGAVATFRFFNPEVNYRYECRWTWGSDVSTYE